MWTTIFDIYLECYKCFNFIFYFNNRTIEELPLLKFLYISADEKDSIRAQVNLEPKEVYKNVIFSSYYYDNNNNEEYLEKKKVFQ